MPSPTTTGSSKPEEVLEAQLDYVAHQLSGTLLEDSRCGASDCLFSCSEFTKIRAEDACR